MAGVQQGAHDQILLVGYELFQLILSCWGPFGAPGVQHALVQHVHLNGNCMGHLKADSFACFCTVLGDQQERFYGCAWSKGTSKDSFAFDQTTL